MKFKRWLKSGGIKGELREPEDFVVREIIEKKFLKKFKRTGKGVQRTKGPYTLFLMKKRNLTTEQAIRIAAKELNVREDDIGFAGLKDRFAVTQQHITIKSDKIKKEKLKMKNVELEKVGHTDKRIGIGNLVANEFEITLHNCRELKNLGPVIDEILERGLPNYFGQQRFGARENNHILGKYLIKRKINKLNTKNKDRAKFFIHAYQSWLFNKTVEKYIGKNSMPCFSDIKIFGYNTKMGNSRFDMILKEITKKEKITQKDFQVNELKLRCDGGGRKAFIKLNEINYKIRGDVVKLIFTLPKGSYATVLINEINICGLKSAVFPQIAKLFGISKNVILRRFAEM